MRKLVDRSLLVGESFKLFKSAIRSAATRDPYERRLAYFLGCVKENSDSFVIEAKQHVGRAEKAVLDFISTEKERVDRKEIAPGTITNGLKAARLLLEMNDVSLNWKKIRRTLPRSRRYALDRIPTMEEMRAIIGNADLRGKALTLTFISSGIREGAIETLKIRDVSPVVRDGRVAAGRMMVYPGDEEQYVTFLTAEAYGAVKEYLDYRARSGEQITPASSLFRDKFDPIENIQRRKIHNTHVHEPKPLNGSAIRRYYNDLFYALGFRESPKRRHEFSVHGFRKWFKTTAERAGMKPIDVETLMGHSTGISDSYYRPTETDLLNSYLTIAPHLTISETEVVKREMLEQESRHQIDIAAVMNELQNLKAQVGILDAQGQHARLSASLASRPSQHGK
ncbi:MAG: tyrosine-type recombinase/integrase [Nitrososphaera sp.]